MLHTYNLQLKIYPKIRQTFACKFLMKILKDLNRQIEIKSQTERRNLNSPFKTETLLTIFFPKKINVETVSLINNEKKGKETKFRYYINEAWTIKVIDLFHVRRSQPKIPI